MESNQSWKSNSNPEWNAREGERTLGFGGSGEKERVRAKENDGRKT